MDNWIFNYNSDNFDFGGGEEFIEVANFAALPVTGESGVIYVTLDTNKLYRWTGSTYVEISASVSPVWGGITGTLSSQTDLQNALNLKQNSLGYTPENVTNKATNLTSPNNTKYPTTLAVSDALNLKQNSLGYTAENSANKATNFTSPDNTKYPTTLAVSDALALDNMALDFTAGVLTYSFYAPYAMKINSVTNVLNAPTTTITTTVGLTPYTLGNTITIGTLINITVSTSSVIRLNILTV